MGSDLFFKHNYDGFFRITAVTDLNARYSLPLRNYTSAKNLILEINCEKRGKVIGGPEINPAVPIIQ
jgi:hypothetical protein